MKKINRTTNIAVIFILIGIFLCQNAAYSYDMSCLRVPLDVDKKRIKEVLSEIYEPLLVSNKYSPTYIDKDKQVILGGGGIVVSHESYKLSSANTSNLTGCFCIIKDTRTGNYAASHILGKGIRGVDYPYKNIKIAVPKMLSLLKGFEPDTRNNELVAIVIGGGHHDEKIRKLAENNYDNLKETLRSEGISIASEEPVSEFEKDMQFSGTNKIDIFHLDVFHDRSAFAIINQTSLYFPERTLSITKDESRSCL